MKIAKASEKDMNAALLLLGILGDVEKGQFPRGISGEFNEDDPDYFDEDEKLHLLALYDRIKYVMDIAPGGLTRVIWGFDTLMLSSNEIVDPNDRCISLHPRFARIAEQRDELLAALKKVLKVSDEAGEDEEYSEEWQDAINLMRTAIAKAEAV